MNDKERFTKIDELIEQINPISYEAIRIGAKLELTKQQKTFSQEELKSLSEKLDKIYKDLNPKFKELRSLQCCYDVTYVGLDVTGKPLMEQHEKHRLFLKTCVQIDTEKHGWQDLLDDPFVQQLINEIRQFVVNTRYPSFQFIEIKRIN